MTTQLGSYVCSHFYLLVFIMASSTPLKTAKPKKCGRQGEGGGCPWKQAQSSHMITQQLVDNVLHGTPWDDDESGAAPGLSREEEALTHNMKKDIQEMAWDADGANAPIGLSSYAFFV